ncbi:thermonuclease family protein [Spirulina sp. 06S082]|uniref:thermonuclease family protein n=1 Tax=Spirulina sp. 06S082 TaxID=3110248 RepID=UPI002B202808|nr:thermonuclease family protein [Spirulina sp. 06S082]MEA5471819.1 thermonuclease family protein [Spirulina sp. 06S082]
MAVERGTTVEATVHRVVDGDTIRVFLPGIEKDESLRILAIDTEESNAGNSKAVTPWGDKAKERAEELFQPNDIITLEFPGNEDIETCLQRYRGNFGRLLVFVHKGEIDFQETMIAEGYSPYFVKYGNAIFPDKHQRYIQAERKAQEKNLGVWNQITVNQTEINNYAALGTWWQLRARIIDEYRRIKPQHQNLFNSRLDFFKLIEKAKNKTSEQVTIFTELRSIRRISQRSGLIKIGSIQQPFSLFLPDLDSETGQETIALLNSRYISRENTYPRRSYAYVTGTLRLFKNAPQISIVSPAQITDEMPSGNGTITNP